MDITVRTGSTRSRGGIALSSLSFESPGGEQACLLLAVSAPARDAKTLEEEASTVIQHSLLASEGEPWHRLDGTLKELNGLFKGLTLSNAYDEINAVVALLGADGTLHVSHAGRGEAYLVRDGIASQVTEFTRGKPLPAFVHISSGPLEPGDVVIFSTQRLLRSLTPAQLAQQAGKGEMFLNEVSAALDREGETASLLAFHVPGGEEKEEKAAPASRVRSAAPVARRGRRTSRWSMDSVKDMAALALPFLRSAVAKGKTAVEKSKPGLASAGSSLLTLTDRWKEFLQDLRDPQRKRRAHLLLLAGAVAAFLIIWLAVSLVITGQRSKSQAQIAELVKEINDQVQTADNRRMAGDVQSANAILLQAEQRAKQVMDNENGLFRVQALDLLDKIHSKEAEINNVIRVEPKVYINLTADQPSIQARGLIGLGNGEFVVYDRRNAYHSLLNKLDQPLRITEDNDAILEGTSFPRVSAEVYLTNGSSLIEVANNQVTTMKTDDPAGWIKGKDIQTYLRYLYVLAPDKKQIYKYERLSNHYGAPSEYNVNGDLTGAMSMAIDTSVYVLKDNGTVLKLLRGEAQPFTVGNAPLNLLQNTTKLFKASGGHFYFLDPIGKRVIVTTDDQNGTSSYDRQYQLTGDQIGMPQDLYVDQDETHLYVVDEKRLYEISLATH